MARLQKLTQQATRLHQADKVVEAERLYRQALIIDPENFATLHALSILRAQQGDGDEAVKLVEAALKADPCAVMAWVNHANLLAVAGRLDEALASYETALKLRPGDVEALHNRGKTLLELQRFAAALGDYDKIVRAKSDDFEVFNDRGTILWRMGRLDEAMASYEKALAIAPNSVDVLNNLGNLLRGLQRPEDAVARFDQALAVDPDLPETLNNRGVALSELRRFDEALVSFDRALMLNPDLPAAWNNRGHTMRDIRRFGDALYSYDRALAIEPDYVAALSNRAKALCESNRVAQAFTDFMRSAALAHGTAPSPAAGAPAHKIQHDREQRGFLAAQDEPAADGFHISGGFRLTGPAINAHVGNGIDIWRDASPRVVVIDNFLTPEALTGLRRFCWGSTIWQTAYVDGYIGAFPEFGFACPLLAQIADELRDTLRDIFAEHPLRYLWAFKYDSRSGGTHVHADEAAVNVNFWITPDAANNDPESGGIIVWDKVAPQDWSFSRFNADLPAARDFLARAGANAVTIPYRANRVVIFDSNLFHQTDKMLFKHGYLNRRINVTLLYGRRIDGSATDIGR